MDQTLAKAVIKVGEGRGFVINQHRREVTLLKRKRTVSWNERLVVTAAHCLPRLPPCSPASFSYERTYNDFLGPLGGPKPHVSAECLFVDPVADVAVLGRPDDQEFCEQAEDYEALTQWDNDLAPVLRIGKAPRKGAAWVLTLDGKWCRCIAEHNNRWIWIVKGNPLIEGGMSGSPILADDGTVIGIVSTGCQLRSCDGRPLPNPGPAGPNPALEDNLPGWLWRTSRA